MIFRQLVKRGLDPSEERITSQLECWKRYAYPVVLEDVSSSRCVPMRTNLISGFQLSVSYWFDQVLQGMGPIRDWVYDFLEKKGISREDIPTRFEDVVKILLERLGTSARVIAYRTMVELYKEFSLSADFDYDDSLPEKFVFLRERVLADRLHPTRTPSLKLAF